MRKCGAWAFTQPSRILVVLGPIKQQYYSIMEVRKSSRRSMNPPHDISAAPQIRILAYRSEGETGQRNRRSTKGRTTELTHEMPDRTASNIITASHQNQDLRRSLTLISSDSNQSTMIHALVLKQSHRMTFHPRSVQKRRTVSQPQRSKPCGNSKMNNRTNRPMRIQNYALMPKMKNPNACLHAC